MSANIPRNRFRLNEDWQATILGLFIALIIGLGVLGPGGQTVTTKAAAGQTASKEVPTGGGYTVSGLLGKDKLPISAPTELNGGADYVFTCQDGVVTLEERPREGGAAHVTVANRCDQDVQITYTRRALIPYPLFRVF